MKQTFLLIVMSVLVGWSAQAQTTTTVEKQTKRITITTTKVDESGKPVTETWIAEGEQPETILRDMAIHPDIIQKVEVASPGEAVDGERLFLFRSAGDNKVIEGKLSEGVDPIAIEADIIIIHDDENGQTKECKKVVIHNRAPSADKMYMHEGRKSNCAALGVYVNSYGEEGCRINSLIEQGGAGEAGLKEGDVIRSIDEFEILDYATLHLAMSHFRPGDKVTVRYEREGKEAKSKVELKDWAQLPGHEYRSRPDCMPETEPVVETPVEDPMLDDPVEVTGMEKLTLEDALAYPNPTEGLFAFSFTTAPGPVTVSVTDVNGKVIYTEENENASGQYNREINLKEYPAGSYILSVKQHDKIFTQQISKQ